MAPKIGTDTTSNTLDINISAPIYGIITLILLVAVPIIVFVYIVTQRFDRRAVYQLDVLSSDTNPGRLAVSYKTFEESSKISTHDTISLSSTSLQGSDRPRG